MALGLVRKISHFILISKLLWRNLECEYLVRVANRLDDDLDLLLTCIGGAFMDAHLGTDNFYFGFHTQPRPGYAMGKDLLHTSEICWEAPVCYSIYLNDKPLVGMAVEFRGSVLCIRQLQGAPHTKLPNDLRSWPKLFIAGSKLYQHNAKRITSIRLYSADQRPSYKYPVADFSPEQMADYHRNLRRRYDGTARQCGFKRVNPRYWEWKPR